MKETTFIRKNIDKWRAAEKVIAKPSLHTPDSLADVYTELTADLAFAQTHYPDSRITLYLNNLCARLHQILYSNKREKWSRMLTYWKREVPLTMFQSRRELLISFITFSFFVLIGVLSTMGDADFPRIILGDYYVDMTLNNI